MSPVYVQNSVRCKAQAVTPQFFVDHYYVANESIYDSMYELRSRKPSF